MFEVGFTEIVLILGLALLVLGPEKLPGLAQKVGRWTGRARSMARQLRAQLEQEVTLEEMAKSRRAEAATTPPPSPPPDPSPVDYAQMRPEEPMSPSHPPHDIGLDPPLSGINDVPAGADAQAQADAPAQPATNTAKTQG